MMRSEEVNAMLKPYALGWGVEASGERVQVQQEHSVALCRG